MTLPDERLNALKYTKDFLRALVDPKKTPKVPKKIRQYASMCLRHFPETFYLESFKNLDKMVKEGRKSENE